MIAYYNDNDPELCKWLRNLIAAGEIAPGDVDDRSIEDVEAKDLSDYTQCHFFAGLGGWSAALRLAGWPDERPVWTGSCPCQPFSAAGKRKAEADERHLWPAFRRLIAECGPPAVFGEQVAGRLGLQWLAGVFTDLAALEYAVCGADLPAACAGAPHIRQRLFWCADAGRPPRPAKQQHHAGERQAGAAPDRAGVGQCRQAGGCADGIDGGSQDGWPQDAAGIPRRDFPGATDSSVSATAEESCSAGGLGDAEHVQARNGEQAEQGPEAANGRHRPPDAGPWSNWVALPYADGEHRRTQPGIFPMAYGLPRSLGEGDPRPPGLDSLAEARASLRRAKRYRKVAISGYGNAIVPQVAAVFIQTVMDAVDNLWITPGAEQENPR